MRFIIAGLCILLLASCSNEKDIIVEDQLEKVTHVEGQPTNIKESEIQKGSFTLTLKSEKDQYKVGEDLNIVAQLTYHGEKAIHIRYAGSWVSLGTTNLTKNYQFGSSMFLANSTTPLASGETISEQYQYTGGLYVEELGGNPYSEDENSKMSKMNFPPGQYKIEAHTDFKNEDNGIPYKIHTAIIFKVVE
ncbi:hypothetical protein [Lysinibacillus sp. 54212]|uniref:hypothetical protein n=1 Tax=Lysinibacillus sp. 54212 TaxID=3119829 RepID=UPI002FCB2DD9